MKEFGRFKSSLETQNSKNGMATLWLQVAQTNQKDHASWVSILNVLVQDICKIKNELKKRIKVFFIFRLMPRIMLMTLIDGQI